MTTFILCQRQDINQTIIKKWQESPTIPGHLEITYPVSGTLFPPDIIAPRISWTDENRKASSWVVVFHAKDREILATGSTLGNQWQPDSLQWEKIKNIGPNHDIHLTVLGCQKNDIVTIGESSIHISFDSVLAPIFYRSVPLPFSFALQNLDSIRWHLGSLSSYHSPPALLKNMPLCGNCHSFTADGKTLAMDVDYANDKGSYVISAIEKETVLTSDKIITWGGYRPQDATKTFGLLSHISPDGRYVLSTVKDRSIFVAKNDLNYSQLFFPIKGILVLYDRMHKEFTPLHGADGPEWVQSNPEWSPDGRTVYFARARAYHSAEAEKTTDVVLPTSVAAEFIEGRRGFQYDIYRVPFNDGNGGTAEPVVGASDNHMSNYFPRVSPDGKWLVFCRAQNFMLLQPDSKLYIMPADGGQARLMTCNSDAMNSWHSWSPNSRWLVFSSKLRDAYTDFLLTHVDEQGNDTPPVLLAHLRLKNRAGNIPEFVNLKPWQWTKIADNFSNQPVYYWTLGKNKMGEKKFREAIQAFDQGIQLDPGYADLYIYKGHAQYYLEEYQNAIATYQKALTLNPKTVEVYINKGTAHYKLKEYPAAISCYERALSLDSDNAYAYYGRGTSRAKSGDLKGSIADFDRAVEKGYKSEKVFYERGLSKALLRQYQSALPDFQTAIRLNPSDPVLFKKLGDCCYQLKKYSNAIDAYNRTLALNPADKEAWSYRALCKASSGDITGAIADYDRAIEISPNSAVDFYQRGMLRMRNGQKDDGCSDLTRAQSLGFQRASVDLQKLCK
jgi:tetratricopeptide (TPR) repeat protein